MRFQLSAFLVAALLVGLAASPAIALWASSGDARVVPGPVAGAGLGYLVVAGGIYVVRRWRKRNTE